MTDLIALKKKNKEFRNGEKKMTHETLQKANSLNRNILDCDTIIDYIKRVDYPALYYNGSSEREVNPSDDSFVYNISIKLDNTLLLSLQCDKVMREQLYTAFATIKERLMEKLENL